MLGLPMALAIIGGMPERFAPFAELFRQSALRSGHDRPTRAGRASTRTASWPSDADGVGGEAFYPGYAELMTAIGRERGWAPMTREQFEAGRALRGATFVGSPQEVIDKILFQHEIFDTSASSPSSRAPPCRTR